MEALEFILFLLAAVAISSILDRFLPRLSLPLVQVALGMVIAALVQSPFESGFDAELLLILFIAPLHFNESRHADSGALWANRWAIASLAVGLVFAIVFAVGFTVHALLPAVPIAIACALGAAMGSTDAVAVTELSKDFDFGRHHKVLLEGESFFNDVTGTVVFQCAVALAVSGTFSLAHASEEFALDFFGGFFGGAVMGFLAWALLEGIRRFGIDKPTLHVTLELILPFVIYLIAKQLHIGAIIAVVIAGMTISLLPHKHNVQKARQKLQSKGVWDTLSYILNGVIFIILGMQLPRVLEPMSEGVANPAHIIGVMLVATLVLEAVRFVWILGMDMVHARSVGESMRDCFGRKSMKGTLAMALAGSKGGVTLSLLLTLPFSLQGGGPFADRAMLLSVASGMILCTLLLANFMVPLLVPHKSEKLKRKQVADSEIKVVELTIESILADARFTGKVRSVESDDAPDAPLSEICDITFTEDEGASHNCRAVFDEEMPDEPATIIVMKRYADQLDDLIPSASKEVKARAEKISRKCNELYDSLGALGTQIQDMDEKEDDAGPITGHFKALREVYDAVEDVQAQALNRELEIIKEMHRLGDISSARAKELRDDVYIQQLAL